MEDSGGAEVATAIVARLGARRAILAVVLSCAVMTYGGVSPFRRRVRRLSDRRRPVPTGGAPKRLIPATIALGAFTFTMTALPGTPAIQNAIPMPYFGTSPFAAPGLGLVTAAVMFGFGAGLAWRGAPRWRRRARRRRRRRVQPVAISANGRRARGFDLMELPVEQGRRTARVGVAVLPLVLVIAVNLAFTSSSSRAWTPAISLLPAYGETSVEQVRGIWSVMAALVFR